MSVVYFLVDKERGECFELGKGWHDPEDDVEVPAPWHPIHADETLALCRRVIGDGGPRATEDPQRVAERLWQFLRGRNQDELILNHGEGDVEYCHPEDHDASCAGLAPGRHFLVVGSRYDSVSGERYRVDDGRYDAGVLGLENGEEVHLYVDQVCTRCGHPPCPCCSKWCDHLITREDQFVLCCDGECSYASEPQFSRSDGAAWS